MKSMKKVLAFALAMLMVLALAGCAKKEEKLLSLPLIRLTKTATSLVSIWI